MKILLPLAALVAGVFALVLHRKNAQADAELWREATAGPTQP